MEHLGTLESRYTHHNLLRPSPHPISKARTRLKHHRRQQDARRDRRRAPGARRLCLGAERLHRVRRRPEDAPAGGCRGQARGEAPGIDWAAAPPPPPPPPGPAPPSPPRHRTVTAPAPRKQTRAGQPLRALDHRGAEPERDHRHHQLHLGARLQCAPPPRRAPAPPRPSSARSPPSPTLRHRRPQRPRPRPSPSRSSTSSSRTRPAATPPTARSSSRSRTTRRASRSTRPTSRAVSAPSPARRHFQRRSAPPP
jgi:hypothetical protein